jgi:hypothetical protein
MSSHYGRARPLVIPSAGAKRRSRGTASDKCGARVSVRGLPILHPGLQQSSPPHTGDAFGSTPLRANLWIVSFLHQPIPRRLYGAYEPNVTRLDRDSAKRLRQGKITGRLDPIIRIGEPAILFSPLVRSGACTPSVNGITALWRAFTKTWPSTVSSPATEISNAMLLVKLAAAEDTRQCDATSTRQYRAAKNAASGSPRTYQTFTVPGCLSSTVLRIATFPG